MNINSVISNRYHTYTISEQKTMDRYKKTAQTAHGKLDSLEISFEAYALQNSDENISATSGTDALGITKGSKENTFIIHFSDSAMVSRAISRGYITVNGVDIQLSDKVKKQLAEVDEQAQTDREKAYSEYIMQHDLAVARQQGDTLRQAYKNMMQAFEIAAKVANGYQVSSEERKKLMETSPELYAMAMAAAATAEKKQDKADRAVNTDGTESAADETQGVSWSDFEWKSYETQMGVSMEETPLIENISEGELRLS